MSSPVYRKKLKRSSNDDDTTDESDGDDIFIIEQPTSQQSSAASASGSQTVGKVKKEDLGKKALEVTYNLPDVSTSHSLTIRHGEAGLQPGIQKKGRVNSKNILAPQNGRSKSDLSEKFFFLTLS